MRETLHIFAKDSRHLWGPIMLVCGALVFFVNGSLAVLPVYTLALQDTWGAGASFLVVRYSPVILVVGWCYLITQVVFADALHGDRQFWLTRPYRRSSLFASKILFVLAYINLPLAVAQISILVLSGSSSLAWPGLLFSHVLIFGLLTGPLLALAAMSVSRSWLVATLVPVAMVLALLLGDLGRLGSFDWVRLALLAVFAQLIAASVLLVQYRYRRTGLARAIVIVGVVVAFGISRGIDWDTAFNVQQRVHGGDTTITASLAPPIFDEPTNRSEAHARGALLLESVPGGLRVPLWFTVGGTVAGSLITCEASRLTVTAESGLILRSPVRLITDRQLRPAADGCPGYLTLPRGADEFLAAPVRIEADLYVTVFDAAHTTDVPLATRRPVPGVGECAVRPRVVQTAAGETWRFADVTCDTAFRSPRVAVTVSAPDILWPPSRPTYAPWPADLRLQPIERMARTFRTEAAAASVETRPVLAHTRLRVTAEGVDLRAYSLRPVR